MSEHRAFGQVASKDGTIIAYERLGSGPPLVLVVGALCSRRLGPSLELSPRLASQFTVFSYDRRGRGESGAGGAHRVQLEIDDLEALIAEAGGSAFVFGHSSGAILALQAAAHGAAIRKLALYEAPLMVEPGGPTMQAEWQAIRAFIAQGRRSEALKVFLKAVGVPAFVVAIMRWLPVWRKLTAVAHTLPYDGAISEEFQRAEPLPANVWQPVTIPVLACAGGKSPAWMLNGMRALARALANAEHRVIEGQSHEVAAGALEPVLKEFFGVG